MLPPDHIPAKSALLFVVFTDLDGTLLDHHNYSHQAAQPALSALAERGIPWILNTSKTLSELKVLAKTLDNPHPIIFENGAGVAFPPGYPSNHIAGLTEIDNWQLKSFARHREEVLKILGQTAEKYQYTGFSQMSVEDIMSHTGLNYQDAERAAQRHYTEPLIWQDSADNYQLFQAALSKCDLHCLKGGRFVHVMSPCDKGAAMLWLSRQLPGVNDKTKLIALGDSGNDIAMLEQADIPVVVRSPIHPPPKLNNKAAVQFTEGYGPSGWNQAILSILQAYDGRQQ